VKDVISCLIYSHNWLNLFVDDSHLGSKKQEILSKISFKTISPTTTCTCRLQGRSEFTGCVLPPKCLAKHFRGKMSSFFRYGFAYEEKGTQEDK
jgi:hypothetical protein